MVIFLSNFLALLIKVDAAGDGRQNALGGLLVAINIGLVVAVIVTSWFATQQSVDDSRDEDNTLNVVTAMITAERLATNDAHGSRASDTARTMKFPSSNSRTKSSVGPAPPRSAAAPPADTSRPSAAALSAAGRFGSVNSGVVRSTGGSGDLSMATVDVSWYSVVSSI